MAVIKSSKIFISIRHPHATCIINAQRKDTATFTTTTHTHTHTSITISPLHTCSRLMHVYLCVRVCMLGRIQETELWMSHFELLSTGRSKGSQTAFWDIIQPPTQQMCRAALPLPWLSLGVFVLGKQHLEFAVYLAFCFSLLWVCYLFFLPFSYFLNAARQYLGIPASSFSEVSEAV